MSKFKKSKSRFPTNLQNGQALLAVVLVMVVALTIALSIAVRVITNLRTSTEDENSQRAFSAAEAGIEHTLATNSSVSSITLTNKASYSTTVSTLSGAEFAVKNGATVLKDEPEDVWFSTYPNYTSPWNGSLVLYWGKVGEVCNNSESLNTQSALEVVIISGSKASPIVTQYAFDPCSNNRTASNKFQVAVTNSPPERVAGKDFAYQSSPITVNSGLIMRIVPLYAPTAIGIKGSIALPSQGTVVSSVGISDTTQRKIVSFRGYPKLPLELFPFIIFSPK